jgi:NAD(P)-dependent dehydrogenase (short-subunit alcohol dehydrogenase family)
MLAPGMAPAPPDSTFRAGLLDGRTIAVARAEERFGTAAARACAALGAEVVALAADLEPAAAALADRANRVEALVVDASAPDHGPPASALDEVWDAVRAVANAAMIPHEHGGKIVLVAPPPGEAAAAPARAALENMARTLSIEWARYGIRAVAIHPGAPTDEESVAGLVAFIASEAGDYLSGCVLDLGASGRA